MPMYKDGKRHNKDNEGSLVPQEGIFRVLEHLWDKWPEPVTTRSVSNDLEFTFTRASRILDFLVRIGYAEVQGQCYWATKSKPLEVLRP